jgi:hypothetical protein
MPSTRARCSDSRCRLRVTCNRLAIRCRNGTGHRGRLSNGLRTETERINPCCLLVANHQSRRAAWISRNYRRAAGASSRGQVSDNDPSGFTEEGQSITQGGEIEAATSEIALPNCFLRGPSRQLRAVSQRKPQHDGVRFEFGGSAGKRNFAPAAVRSGLRRRFTSQQRTRCLAAQPRSPAPDA